MTASTIMPALRYRDAHAAIAWLGRAFGLHPQAVYDGPNGTVAHAQLTLDGGMVMLGSASGSAEGSVTGDGAHSIYIVVKDAAAVYETARAANAEMVMPLQQMDYGGMGFGCKDPEGYSWSLGEYDPWA